MGSGSHKRSLSMLWEEQQVQMSSTIERCREMDWLELLQGFAAPDGEMEAPALCEDFHSFMARELGSPEHPWISAFVETLVPSQDEDFVSYFARYNGIVDTGVVNKLRQVIDSPSPRLQEHHPQRLELRKIEHSFCSLNSAPCLLAADEQKNMAMDKWSYPRGNF